MPRPTLLLGALLDILDSFAASPSVSDQRLESFHRPTNARAVVAAIDLREAPSSEVTKECFKTFGAATIEEAQRHTQLEHFFVIYVATPAGSKLLATSAAELALQAHASFERELGAFVDVIVIDVSACTDSALLAQRMTLHIRRRPGSVSDSALCWTSIAADSIAAVTANDSC
ncbi:hypothetical protein [Pseudoclavibacter helvolus]|uniref:hypothetical protein n=1 Tax=Pseudoclavibacter helvolus TaxID=255205 RepID=UPI0008395925|nr:hypothetical protein [Pseudoclavibacter helvolus]